MLCQAFHSTVMLEGMSVRDNTFKLKGIVNELVIIKDKVVRINYLSLPLQNIHRVIELFMIY